MMSLLWVRTAPEAHRHKPTPGFAFLRDERRYRNAFESLEGGKSGPEKLGLPWGTSGDRFWDFYTSRLRDGNRGQLAWTHGLPLLRHAPVALPKPADGGYAASSLYVYPHGLALVLTFRMRGPFTLTGVATRARDLRYGPIRLDSSRLTPALFASAVLARNGAQVWGPDAALSDAAAEPFTICTVIRATGADWKVRVEEEGELHRFLDKVAGWYDRDRAPDALESCRISSPRTDGHLLYGHRRSRCVWFPEHFDTGDQRHSLLHYHRNLTFASMQTESLAQYVCRADDDLRDPGYLSIPQRAYAHHVLQSVDRLNEGRPEYTYRSRSPARQLQDNGTLGRAQRVREYLDQVL
ncbi:MAG TPA: hypothetical protein VF006_03250 [Longimicrobium sp.]